MRHFIIPLKKSFSSTKVYYPALLSPNYDTIEYAPSYVSNLNEQSINQHQNCKEKIKTSFKSVMIPYLNFCKINSMMIRNFLSNKNSFCLEEGQMLVIFLFIKGKSSLINSIFNDNEIARKSKHAGTTKFLHFHEIHNENCFVVDAPGYGYANMNKRRRHLWFGLTEEYMKVSTRLSQIFLLINFEHGLKEIDKEFIARADRFNVNIQLVMTKVDKVKEEKYFSQFRAINEEIRRMELKNVNDLVLACSTKTKFGMNFLKARIVQAIEQSIPRMTDMNEDLLLSYVKELRVQPTDINEKQHQLSKEHIVRKLIYNSKLTKFLV